MKTNDMLNQRITNYRTSYVHIGTDECQSGEKQNWGEGGSDHAFPLLHPHLGGDAVDVPGQMLLEQEEKCQREGGA